MRIIGGKYKGKIFNPPTNLKARPTTDFAKEGLFDIIQNTFNVENLKILDLFSGTGSISYEFASRGVKHITIVESNFNHVNFIKKQFQLLDFKDVDIFKSDVFRYLKTCRQKFDIIFADPPYDLENIEEIYNSVFENSLLSENSWLIIEHSDKNDFSKYPYFLKLKRYGSVHFSIFDFDCNS